MYLAKIDKFGRLLIPAKVRREMGMGADSLVEVDLVEDKPRRRMVVLVDVKARSQPSIVEELSRLNLPVSDWRTMKKEIEEGKYG